MNTADCVNCDVPHEAHLVKTSIVNLHCGHTVYGLRLLGDQVVCPFCYRLVAVCGTQKCFLGCIADSGYLYCKMER